MLVEVPFYSIRNASCPEDLENGRKVLFGHMPARATLEIDTEENVRDYLVDVPGKTRRVYKHVHRSIRETLENSPEKFSVLNGGVCIVAREYEVDEKNKVLRLLGPSIINGSQTRGVIGDYYREKEKKGETPPPIHVTFELIVTEDHDLIAETSIARNFQEDVMAISIVGQRGQLDELELALQRVYPDYKLRQSETHIADEYVVTERLIQVITALIPAELWPKEGEEKNPNKTYTYSAKAKCLKEFQSIYMKAKDQTDPEHEKYNKLYRFYLDIAPQAYALHQKWKTHQGMRGEGRIAHAVKKEGSKVVDVPDGMVFPILAALSNFAEQTPEGWQIVEPPDFVEDELIDAAIEAYKETARSDPQKMGKSKVCYSQLHRVTSIYRRRLDSR